MRCIICRPDLRNLKNRKMLKMYIVVRTELSLNENTKISQIETMVNPLDMLGICCII